ncbi:MAG: hypothetical protein WEB58_20245, partial [Planctomycetaceae bacterium]
MNEIRIHVSLPLHDAARFNVRNDGRSSIMPHREKPFFQTLQTLAGASTTAVPTGACQLLFSSGFKLASLGR